tara:strand:- start:372 stop:839 length:468 start_codon:yes stop_codon:yes gene_type:complete
MDFTDKTIIVEGSVIILCQNKKENKLQYIRKSVTKLKELLSVNDWEWYYIYWSMINNKVKLEITDMVKIIKAVKEEKYLVMNDEEINDLIYNEPTIVYDKLRAIKKLQKWFRHLKRVKSAIIIQRVWLKYYYKPSSKLGIVKAQKSFEKSISMLQ